MAKKKTSRGTRSLTIPLATVAGLAAGLNNSVGAYVSGTITGSEAMRRLSRDFTGYDPLTRDWRLDRLSSGLLPIVVGVLASMIASKLGINRALARKIPFIRV